MSSDSDQPFQVVTAEGSFDVADRSGRVVLSFRDRNSAHQYVALLNDAFRRGYRSGYRDGKNAATRRREP